MVFKMRGGDILPVPKLANTCHSGGRGQALRLFLLVFLALPLPLLNAVQSTFAVAGAGLGRRQGVHVQNLVDLTEGQQPQRVLEGRNDREGRSVELMASFFVLLRRLF